MSSIGRRRQGRLVCAVVVAMATLSGFPEPALAVEGSWRSTGSLNVPRTGSTANLLGNGDVLVAGGRNFALTDSLESAEVYDPETETFSLTGSMATGRWSHTGTTLNDGRVLVAGGFTDPTTNLNAQPVTDTAEIYNAATGTWTQTPPMNVRRALHVAELLLDGRVLVAGGRTCNAPPPVACNFTFVTRTAEVYNPATNTWTLVASMASDRHTTSAVRLLDGRVLVPAGFPGGQNTAEIYDPATNTWTPTGPLSIPRARQGAMLLPNGHALVAAGAIGGTPPLTSETYDPATNTWTPAGNVAQPRFNYFYTELASGKVLIAGGASGPTASTTAEVYDPATRTWGNAGTLPNPHGSSSSLGNTTRMVRLANGKVLLVGDNPNGAAELYTPASSFVCTTTLSGPVGDVVVPDGSVTCLNGADVSGSITIQPGGSLVLTNSRVVGGITSQGSTGIRICGSQIRSETRTSVSIVGTVGPVIIGDGTAGCARNDIDGSVRLEGNHFVELDTNRITGNVSVLSTTGSNVAPVVAANQIAGGLDCVGNIPPPTNEGRPNTVIGPRTGQCTSL